MVHVRGVPGTIGNESRVVVTQKAKYIHLYIYNMCVFFSPFGIFLSSGRGSFLVLSAPWRTGSPPGPHTKSLGPGRGPRHVLWSLKVARLLGEVFRASRAIQADANPRVHNTLLTG